MNTSLSKEELVIELKKLRSKIEQQYLERSKLLQRVNELEIIVLSDYKQVSTTEENAVDYFVKYKKLKLQYKELEEENDKKYKELNTENNKNIIRWEKSIKTNRALKELIDALRLEIDRLKTLYIKYIEEQLAQAKQVIPCPLN